MLYFVISIMITSIEINVLLYVYPRLDVIFVAAHLFAKLGM